MGSKSAHFEGLISKNSEENMSDSKTGSKSDLNESNMPLLDDDQTEKAGETPEKEQIELTEEGAEEKDDSKETEKTKKKKEKKEKKKKEKKKKKNQNHKKKKKKKKKKK